MRVLKGISLFFLLPLVMLTLGFWAGVKTEHFFYPGSLQLAEKDSLTENAMLWMVATVDAEDEATVGERRQAKDEATVGERRQAKDEATVGERRQAKDEATAGERRQAKDDATAGERRQAKDDAAVGNPESTKEYATVWSGREVLSADTEYVVLETDILHGTEVETIRHVPSRYMGLDREQFVTAMENYSKYPPLSERERGFVNSEVLSFSGERVEVRLNYRMIDPDEGFYLAVRDHEVVVYLEDKETIYLYTDIDMDTLPEEVQLQLMDMLYVKNEEKLYGFLETYSS